MGQAFCTDKLHPSLPVRRLQLGVVNKKLQCFANLCVTTLITYIREKAWYMQKRTRWVLGRRMTDSTYAGWKGSGIKNINLPDCAAAPLWGETVQVLPRTEGPAGGSGMGCGVRNAADLPTELRALRALPSHRGPFFLICLKVLNVLGDFSC